MINGLSLGHYYFNIAFLFRETILLNGILTNLEVWHPINNNQIEVLERVDLMLLRKTLKSHSKTPKEAFFLETGLLPIKYVAIQRRLMYLHTILSRPESELIRKVYQVQKSLHTSCDWYEKVTEERNKMGLGLNDEQISVMSKEKYKVIISKCVQKYALECLSQTAIKNENSKYRRLLKSDLVREKYLTDNRFSRSECELLFSLRTQMIPGIRTNFSSQYGNDLLCELCSLHQDSQENLLSCVKLTREVEIPSDMDYEDIYGSVDKQLRIVKLFKQLLRTREILKCE